MIAAPILRRSLLPSLLLLVLIHQMVLLDLDNLFYFLIELQD